jgi:hypothetical protein
MMSYNYLQWIVKVLTDFIKFGIPITFSIDTSNSLVYIRGKKGFLILSLIPLLDPVTGDAKSIGVAEIGSSHYTPIGFMNIDGERDTITIDYRGLLKVLANRVLTVFEADLWALRLVNSSMLRAPEVIPEWLTYVKEKGLRVMELVETCDYAIGVNDVIGVWINVCTGKVDLALEEQEKMNIMKWGSLKEFLVNWVKQFESI